MIWLTLAILLTPPIKTAATQKERIREAMTTDQEYSPRNGRIFTVKASFGSKKPCTALEIPLTWLKVPMPKRPTQTPKKAKIFASHLKFLPMPSSI